MTEVPSLHHWIAGLPALVGWGTVGALLLVGLLLARAWSYRRDGERLRHALHDRELGEARLAMALEASDAAEWECDIVDGRFSLSDRYYEQLGYAPGAFEPTMKAWRALLHPDDAPEVLRRIRATLRPDSGAYSAEYRMLDAQGQWRWMLSRGRVLRRCAEGEAQLMMGTHQDIHEAKSRQQAQLQMMVWLEKIYESTLDAIGVISVAREAYVNVNPGFSRMFGYSREELIGRSALEIQIWGDPAQRERFWLEYQRLGRVESMEILARRKDGQMVSGLVSALNVVENGEPCVLFVYRDLTESQRLQRAAEAAHAEVAAAAAANLAKTEFLSRMSHELRTPLNAVLGFAQLLRDAPVLAGETAQPQREQVESILNAGWHLLTLIDDVLDIARIEAGHLQVRLRPVPLAQVLRGALELLQPQAQRADIWIVADESLLQPQLRVDADELRLRQVLINLLSNAVKYNRPGGRVSLSGELRPEEGRLLLRVADTGMGMDEQQLAHLFEPFNRLGREHDSIEGAGIGLVLTRHLLELMGSSLSVQSQPGVGTTVQFELPLLAAAQSTAPAPLQQPEESADAVRRARLLYIEDNPVNQLIVAQLLAGMPDIELHLADTAEQGLQRAEELRPSLILLDMRLPDADGLDVLARLKADPRLAAIQVVALSASAMPEEVERACALGAAEYWTKPIHFDRFRDELRRILA